MTEFATLEDLLGKQRRSKPVELTLPQPDGSVRKVSLLFRALSGEDYDDLVAKHPPTDKQRKDGMRGFNPDTFPPALVAASLVQPQLTVDQVKGLWGSSDWSDGERASLFGHALEVNQAGLEIPFTGPDSDETGSSS